jgi:hypothetical protein
MEKSVANPINIGTTKGDFTNIVETTPKKNARI